MSAATLPRRPASALRDAAAFVWGAWTATTRRHWAWVLVIGLVILLVTLPQKVDVYQKVGLRPLVAATDIGLPLLASVMMFLGWVLADAGSDAWRSRRTRLVYALFGTAAVTTLTGVGLWHLTGTSEFWAEYFAMHGKEPKSISLMVAAEYLNMLIVSGMVYAVAEVVCQRMRTQRAFEAVVHRQATLERQVLESRLSAMQAQVEPRFLFDTLVDIEALYQRSPPEAAANLDRLIAFLRAALPRLRESGSTVAAEIELLRTYLDVVTALHGGRPELAVSVAEPCQQRRFFPMLLLPLMQRAVRNPSGVPPEAIAIDVSSGERETIVRLRFALPGGCADDPEMGRVRERLAGLYGGAASLDCVETAGDAVELTLRIPNEAEAGR